jgi:hypothetical protein
MSHDTIRTVALLALGSLGLTNTCTLSHESEPDMILDLLDSPPVPRPRLRSTAPRPHTTEHKHSREIERRLRQQARLEAKRRKP